MVGEIGNILPDGVTFIVDGEVRRRPQYKINLSVSSPLTLFRAGDKRSQTVSSPVWKKHKAEDQRENKNLYFHHSMFALFDLVAKHGLFLSWDRPTLYLYSRGKEEYGPGTPQEVYLILKIPQEQVENIYGDVYVKRSIGKTVHLPEELYLELKRIKGEHDQSYVRWKAELLLSQDREGNLTWFPTSIIDVSETLKINESRLSINDFSHLQQILRGISINSPADERASSPVDLPKLFITLAGILKLPVYLLKRIQQQYNDPVRNNLRNYPGLTGRYYYRRSLLDHFLPERSFVHSFIKRAIKFLPEGIKRICLIGPGPTLGEVKYLLKITAPDIRIYVIEFWNKNIRNLRKELNKFTGEERSRVFIVQADARNIPFVSNVFDFIYSAQTFCAAIFEDELGAAEKEVIKALSGNGIARLVKVEAININLPNTDFMYEVKELRSSILTCGPASSPVENHPQLVKWKQLWQEIYEERRFSFNTRPVEFPRNIILNVFYPLLEEPETSGVNKLEIVNIPNNKVISWFEYSHQIDESCLLCIRVEGNRGLSGLGAVMLLEAMWQHSKATQASFVALTPKGRTLAQRLSDYGIITFPAQSSQHRPLGRILNRLFPTQQNAFINRGFLENLAPSVNNLRSSSPLKENRQFYPNSLYSNGPGRNGLERIGRISGQFYKVRDNIVKFPYISMLGIK